MSKYLLNKKSKVKLDIAEGIMIASGCPIIDLPLVHRFTKGMYIREIFMPKGTLLTSKIHKTEHPFVVSKGSVSVWISEDDIQTIEAPYCGITKPGTRRMLYIHEDCIWLTMHRNDDDCQDLDIIEDRLIEPNDNEYLPEEIKKRFKLTGIKKIKKEKTTLCLS